MRELTYVVGVVEKTTIVALRWTEWGVEQSSEAGARPKAVDKASGASGPRPQFWTVRTLALAVTWGEGRRAGQRVVDVAARAWRLAPAAVALDAAVPDHRLMSQFRLGSNDRPWNRPRRSGVHHRVGDIASAISDRAILGATGSRPAMTGGRCDSGADRRPSWPITFSNARVNPASPPRGQTTLGLNKRVGRGGGVPAR